MRLPGIRLRDEYLEPSFVEQEVRRRKEWMLANGQLFYLRAKAEESSIFWILAALSARLTIVPIHPASTAEEIRRFRDVLGDAIELSDEKLAAITPMPFTRKDMQGVSAILFSSGSTGVPKAIAITERNLLASARAHEIQHGLTPSDRWLLSLPLFHIGGFSIISRAYFLGQDIAFSAQLNVEEAVFWMGSGLVTGLSMVPTLLWRVLEKNPNPACKAKLLLLGGAALPNATRERALRARLPIKVSYGLTESCSQVFSDWVSSDSSPQYAGRAHAGVEYRVLESGELCLRGEMISPGNWHNGEIINDRDEESFLHTGDLVELDREMRLSVQGREGDLIISGGENIFPVEVEDAILSIEWIVDVAVVGIPSEEWGKQIGALVVLRETHPADPEQELRKLLRDKINPWKQPKRYLFGKNVPRNAMKKIIRQEVLQLFLP